MENENAGEPINTQDLSAKKYRGWDRGYKSINGINFTFEQVKVINAYADYLHKDSSRSSKVKNKNIIEFIKFLKPQSDVLERRTELQDSLILRIKTIHNN